MTRFVRVSRSGEAKVPRDICERLGLRPGDAVAYEIEGDHVILRKAEGEDSEFLRLQDDAFSEWASDADEEAYANL